MACHPTRKLTILALDPSVRTDGKILRAQTEVPNEALEPGPRGYRAFIVRGRVTTKLLRPSLMTAQRASPP
jgi:hypothetical protein